MKYNLDNNQELISFFNELFKHEELANFAPNIIKFFIITRNYGLIDFENNIQKLINNTNPNELALKAIKEEFSKREIPFNKENLVTLLITNYHDNGFYFHSFPGIYKDSILKNGILASQRNEKDNIYFAIASKYHFGDYYTKSENRICVSEKIRKPDTNEYAIFTPEWLYIFLKSGNKDITNAFANGDINELTPIVSNALNYFKNGMQRNPLYDEKDYQFLCTYIKEMTEKRFAKDNNEIGIAFIEKRTSDNYFKKHIKKEDTKVFQKYINERNMNDKEIVDFIIETLSNGEKTTNQNIPKELVNIVSYQTKNNMIEQNKALK